MSCEDVKTEEISDFDYSNPLRKNGTLLIGISDDVISKISDLIVQGINIPCSLDSPPPESQSDDQTDDDSDDYSSESETSVQSEDSWTPNNRSTYRSRYKTIKNFKLQRIPAKDFKSRWDVQWLCCGSFDSWEEVQALRKHKGAIMKETMFISRKGVNKTNYRCRSWNITKCPYKMYSVVKEGDTTHEVFEANEHSALCKKILAGIPVRNYYGRRDYKQRRQSWHYPSVQNAMEQFVKDEKKFTDLDELVSELSTAFQRHSRTLNLKYYLTHYSDSSKILDQLIPDRVMSEDRKKCEQRARIRQMKVKGASQILLKAAQEKWCREERLRIFKESGTIHESQSSQCKTIALGQIQSQDKYGYAHVNKIRRRLNNMKHVTLANFRRELSTRSLETFRNKVNALSEVELDNDSRQIPRNFPRIEHDYHLLSYCKPVTEFKTKNEATRYCSKRSLYLVSGEKSEEAVKYRCHVKGCQHAVYCVRAENGNFVVWSNEQHNHDDDTFYVGVVDALDAKKAYAGSAMMWSAMKQQYQFSAIDAEATVNNTNDSYLPEVETASCSTAVQKNSANDKSGYVRKAAIKQTSSKYANGFMKFSSRVDAHIYLHNRGMRQTAYIPEWGSIGCKYRLTYKCGVKDCPFIMTGIENKALGYDKGRVNLWTHHHHNHPEPAKDCRRKLPESSSPPNDRVRPAKLRRIEVVNDEENDGPASGKEFDNEDQTTSTVSPVIKPELLSDMSECNIQKSSKDNRSDLSRKEPLIIKSEPPSEMSGVIAVTDTPVAISKKTVSSIQSENGNRGSENRIGAPVFIPYSPINCVNTFYDSGKSGSSEPTFNIDLRKFRFTKTWIDANRPNSSTLRPAEPPAKITAFDTAFRQSQYFNESVPEVAEHNNESEASTSKKHDFTTKTGNGDGSIQPKLQFVPNGEKSTSSNRPLHVRVIIPYQTRSRPPVSTAPIPVKTESDNAIQACGQVEVSTSGAPKLSCKSKSNENALGGLHGRNTVQSLNEFESKSTFSPDALIIKPEPVSEMINNEQQCNIEPIASTSTQSVHNVMEEEMTGLRKNSNATGEPFQQSQNACETQFPNQEVQRNTMETNLDVTASLSAVLASKYEGLKKRASHYQQMQIERGFKRKDVVGCARCRPFTFDTLITAVRNNKYHFFAATRLQQEEEQKRRTISEPVNEQEIEIIDEHHGNDNLQRLTTTKEVEQNQSTVSTPGNQSNVEVELIRERTSENETHLTEIAKLRQEVEKLKIEKQEYLKIIEELRESGDFENLRALSSQMTGENSAILPISFPATHDQSTSTDGEPPDHISRFGAMVEMSLRQIAKQHPYRLRNVTKRIQEILGIQQC